MKNMIMQIFQGFCQLVSKLSLKLQKIGLTDISHGKNMKFSFIKSAQKMTFLAQKIRFFCITFETYATVRFGSSAGLV